MPSSPDTVSLLWMCVPRAAAAVLTVSRYATCNWLTRAFTPNSRSIRSVKISKWSSPMPEMIRCPVSLSIPTVNVGSSSINFWSVSSSASASLARSGSIAIEMTGGGKSMEASRIGCAGAVNVSPVFVCFIPTSATMSPAKAVSHTASLFACIWRMRFTRSRFPVLTFKTTSPRVSVPE